MNQYDPKAISKMAAILHTVARITIVVFGLAAAASIVTVLGLFGGEDGLGAAALLLGLIYGAVILGMGYLIALVLRVGAQLMLAVVKIEFNTAAALSVESARQVDARVAQTQTIEEPRGNPLAAVRPSARAKSADQVYALTESIKRQSHMVSSAGDSAGAEDIFELGRLWARLYHRTSEPQHREKALNAMRKAHDIDPDKARLSFFDQDDIGSLAMDPDFAEFVSR